MGLCKCPKRKVTNLFCFEHDVNVCEDCLVTDHQRCIVQSYVQWLQDSEYNPICLLCNELLKEKETIRLVCYDVFHWSCLDKYASQLPANTAPAGYQCPKCKEGIFPPPNIVSPVARFLREKLESVEWSRVGQSLLKYNENNQQTIKTNKLKEDETNGFVIVNEQNKQKAQENSMISTDNLNVSRNFLNTEASETSKLFTSHDDEKNSFTNRMFINDNIEVRRNQETTYDPSLGVILNISNLDRDVGDNKYQRRPILEWLNQWLRSRQMNSKFRMTRRKKYAFIIILIFLAFLTFILIMSQLGEMNTEDDPAFDPLNNPNIHVEGE